MFVGDATAELQLDLFLRAARLFGVVRQPENPGVAGFLILLVVDLVDGGVTYGLQLIVELFDQPVPVDFVALIGVEL